MTEEKPALPLELSDREWRRLHAWRSRIDRYATKIAADAAHGDSCVVRDLSDHCIAELLANCARPPKRYEYDAIRAAFAAQRAAKVVET